MPIEKRFILTILRLLLFTSTTHAYCGFPGSLYGRTKHWVMYGPGGEPFEIFDGAVFPRHREMSFDSYFITVFYPDPLRVAYYLTCIERVDNNRGFLMNLLYQDGTSLGYLCVDIIVESTTVVRLKSSQIYPAKSMNMCTQAKLMPCPAPLLYYNKDYHFWLDSSQAYAEYIECPVKGGFVMSWMDRIGNHSTGCNSRWPLRFESECAQGTGLSFSSLSRTDGCQLPLLGDNRGFDYCLATWQDANYTFFVSTLTTLDGTMPCFRVQNNLDTLELSMFVFLDGACDFSADLSISTEVIEVKLRQFPVLDTCSDLSPSCKDGNMTSCDVVGVSDVTCRDTCQICPELKPWDSAFFAQQFKGVWFKDSQGHPRSPNQTKERIVIGDKYLQIGDDDVYENFGKAACSQGPTPRQSHDLGGHVTEYVVVKLANNGCSPRVSAIQITRRSPGVLSYRMSRSVSLRIDPSHLDVETSSGLLKLLKDFDHWCIQTDYVLYGPAPVYAMYRTYGTGWFNAVSALPSVSPVFCGSFPSKPLSLIVHSLRGKFCSVIIKKQQDKTRLSMSIAGCVNKTGHAVMDKVEDSVFTLSCLANFAATNLTFLLTQIDMDMDKRTNQSLPSFTEGRTALCWVYDNRSMTGYIFTVSDCDTSIDSGTDSSHKILPTRGFQDRQPLAEFNATTTPSSGSSNMVSASLCVEYSLLLVSSFIAISHYGLLQDSHPND